MYVKWCSDDLDKFEVAHLTFLLQITGSLTRLTVIKYGEQLI